MRSSLNRSLSFEGTWIEDSNDPLKTSVRYRLFNYGHLIRYRNGSLNHEDVAKLIIEVSNAGLDDSIYPFYDYENILTWLKGIDADDYSLILKEMLDDSFLKIEEFRRLEFIIYYLNWKSDEHTRRMSYNCDDCRKFDYLKSRFCYLEESEFELPVIGVKELDDGTKEFDNSGENKLISEVDYLKMLNEVTSVKQASIFELSNQYYGKLLDDSGKYMEVCPEAFKINSENLAELFEMESRCHEYGIYPFDGGQLDQPALLVEAFDAIRMGRNTFHSKKMDDMSRSNRGK